MTEEELLRLARAIALANKHGNPDDWAARVVEAYKTDTYPVEVESEPGPAE